jgi:branched-chain amino acid transport system permease protein
VMMFMPTGLAGLFGTLSHLHRRLGIRAVAPVTLLILIAALLLSSGAVFAIEMLQRVFSQDYLSLATVNANMPWPPITLLGRSWSPVSASTWLLPFALLVVGGTVTYIARRWLHLLDGREERTNS